MWKVFSSRRSKAEDVVGEGTWTKLIWLPPKHNGLWQQMEHENKHRTKVFNISAQMVYKEKIKKKGKQWLKIHD